MPTANERRRNQRVSFEALIDLSSGDKKFPKCQTENLSTKGVLVLGVTGIPMDTECDIILNLTGSSNISLNIKGIVQRITDHGVGIHFTEIDLDSFTHLKNIIYYNSENPDIIDESY